MSEVWKINEREVIFFIGSENKIVMWFLCRIKPIVADKGANVLLEMMESRGIEDIWRHRNPDIKKFTWSHTGKNVASRIDYWLISKSLDPFAKHTDIVKTIFSDHAAIILSLKLSDIERGRRYWKINNQIIATKRFQECFEIGGRNGYWPEKSLVI